MSRGRNGQGGKTTLSNLVLASKEKNQARGCKDLKEFAMHRKKLKDLGFKI